MLLKWAYKDSESGARTLKCRVIGLLAFERCRRRGDAEIEAS